MMFVMLLPLFWGSCEVFIHRLSGLLSSCCSRPNWTLRRKKKGKTIKNNKNKNVKQPSSFPPRHPETKLQQARLRFGSQITITPLSTGTRESHFICLNFRTKLFSRGNFHSCCRFTPEGARSLARLCCLKWCWKLTLWALSLNVVLTFPF